MIQFQKSIIRTLAQPIESPVRILDIDPWTASSAFQKAIRRGDCLAAQCAGLTLLSKRSSTFWRRLVIVAFEDVGVASYSAMIHTIRLAFNKQVRSTISDEATIAANLIRLLAISPKSRASEQLLTAANWHPDFQIERGLSEIDIQAELLALSESANAKFRCSLAAARIGQARGVGLATGLLIPYARAGVPDDVITATEAGFRDTRDSIALVFPLVWLLGFGKGATKPSSPPEGVKFDGLPSYALDKHTLIGREAIRAFVKSCGTVRTCLTSHVIRSEVNNAAYMASFYTDGALLASKYTWEGSEEIERLAVEADLIKSGVARQGVGSILHAFRANLDQLDECRARSFYRRRRAATEAEPMLPGKWGR